MLYPKLALFKVYYSLVNIKQNASREENIISSTDFNHAFFYSFYRFILIMLSFILFTGSFYSCFLLFFLQVHLNMISFILFTGSF